MGSDYVQVAIAEDAGTIELPKETDGTLLLTTLAAQFPGVTGLKFRSEKSGGMIGVRLANGRFHVPETDGWRDPIYYCVINKVEDTKRKLESDEEDFPPNKKIGNKFICQRSQDLVVLDLPWKTTEGELREYFEGFGDLVLAQIKKDLKTGQSKGYGFIRFSNYDSQVRVLGQRHFIRGRWCDVKIPKSKKGPQRLSPSIKVHVGRLTEDITENDLHEYFSTFGEVTHVFIPNKPFQGFAFVSFLNADVAQSVCRDDHIIKNVSVTVAESNPRPDSRSKDSSRRDNYDDHDKEPYSREQNSYGSSGGQGQGQGGGGGQFNDYWQVGGFRSGNGPGTKDIPPKLNQPIVSAVLNQLTGGMQGESQGQMKHQQQQQQQQYNGDRNSSHQNIWETSYPGLVGRPVKRDSLGRLRGDY